jgi:hypothetical protein
MAVLERAVIGFDDRAHDRTQDRTSDKTSDRVGAA